MSENRPDDFVEASADQSAQEVSSVDEALSPREQPGEETPEAQEQAPAEKPDQPTATEAENTLPPEARGEANGGPLGCCLGTMIGLLLSLSLAIVSRFYATELGTALQGNYWLLGLIVRVLMGILAFALAIFFGYVGWKLGKRFYREYETPTPRRRTREKKLHQRV